MNSTNNATSPNRILHRSRATVVLFALLLALSPAATANGNASTDLAAPYIHFGTTDSYTTYFVVTNRSGIQTGITIKCYNRYGARIGPVGGSAYTALPHGINVFNAVTLGLTSSPFFGDGIGWCYFWSASENIAVTTVMGISDNTGNLIPANSVRGLSADTAQGVASFYASIPWWTQEGQWVSYHLALFPRPKFWFGGNVFYMSVFDNFGALQGSSETLITERNLLVSTIKSGPANWGSAEIFFGEKEPLDGYMGWVLGFNYTSLESFQYSVPTFLKSNAHALDAGDRP